MSALVIEHKSRPYKLLQDPLCQEKKKELQKPKHATNDFCELSALCISISCTENVRPSCPFDWRNLPSSRNTDRLRGHGSPATLAPSQDFPQTTPFFFVQLYYCLNSFPLRPAIANMLQFQLLGRWSGGSTGAAEGRRTTMVLVLTTGASKTDL